MNKKILFIFLIVAVGLAGCASHPSEYMQAELDGYLTDKSLASLADVEFAIVPEWTYYLLLEETLDNERSLLSRRYVKYDGFQNTITEVIRESELPRSFQSALFAKEWLRENAPAELSLFPNTYLNDRVLDAWEQEGYDYTIESEAMLFLENLKRVGAITRINEMLEISHDNDRLTEVIEQIEKYLPSHRNLRVDRALEALPGSFLYQTSLVLYAEPLNRFSVAITESTIKLAYSVDELGNPLDLTLTAEFNSKEPRASYALKPVVNDMAAFAWALRVALVNELGLYGVSSVNPSLEYANVTLHYERNEETTRFSERFSIR